MAEKIHTGLRIDESLLQKMKYVAWNDRRTFTSVTEIAMEEFIAAWEEANGKITAKKIEDAKIK